jgi:predicted dithiol-disulfide oxidoreductase (DUF899 family)
VALPEVVSRDEWLAARTELLAREKQMTKARDELSAARRRLPMVEMTKDYRFRGPQGEVGLIDLFEGRNQLVIVHFMFDPSWEDGCPSCTAGADEVAPGMVKHLHARDTTLAYVSRAPLEKLERYKAKRGWTFPWYSSGDGDFSYDFRVTVDERRVPGEYNYRTAEEWKERGPEFEMNGEYPGRSHFLRDGDRVFHTYSVYARGTETIGGSYYLLDETALGRQEEWEEPKGRAASVRGATPDFAA